MNTDTSINTNNNNQLKTILTTGLINFLLTLLIVGFGSNLWVISLIAIYLFVAVRTCIHRWNSYTFGVRTGNTIIIVFYFLIVITSWLPFVIDKKIRDLWKKDFKNSWKYIFGNLKIKFQSPVLFVKE